MPGVAHVPVQVLQQGQQALGIPASCTGGLPLVSAAVPSGINKVHQVTALNITGMAHIPVQMLQQQ